MDSKLAKSTKTPKTDWKANTCPKNNNTNAVPLKMTPTNCANLLGGPATILDPRPSNGTIPWMASFANGENLGPYNTLAENP